LLAEQIADVSERLEQGVKGSGTDASQVGLEFRKGHFDRVEIGAVSGQKRISWRPALTGRILRGVGLIWPLPMALAPSRAGSGSAFLDFVQSHPAVYFLSLKIRRSKL
jgi:hypothetical protein